MYKFKERKFELIESVAFLTFVLTSNPPPTNTFQYYLYAASLIVLGALALLGFFKIVRTYVRG